MLRIYDAIGEAHPITNYEDCYVDHKFDGNDTLSFCVNTSSDDYKLIEEELKIENADNEWLIKKISDDKIDCELNFDFLKTTVFRNYESRTRTLAEVLSDHIPSDWTIEGANVTATRRTIKFDYCTGYDVVMQCMSTYAVKFIWKIKSKRLLVYDPDLVPSSGEYVTSDLNLRALSFKGESIDFATRLYAFGANGVTMERAEVDDGKGGTKTYGKMYVENYSYRDKVVCAIWEDNRYTSPQSLYEEALKKIASLSYPVRSYESDVIDLAKLNEEYEFLNFSMPKKITLIDRERGIKVEHLIVQYREYEHDHERNKVTLSCVPDNIVTRIQKVQTSTNEIVIKEDTTYNAKIEMATAMLVGVFGGHIYSNGSEIFLMDQEDPNTAQIVWRWNVAGFAKSSTGINGPYTTALTFDDSFITSVIESMIIRGQYIEAGTIEADKIAQSYTDDVLRQSYEVAEGLVKSAISQLTEYLTNTDGSGEIDVLKKTVSDLQQEADAITVRMSEAYYGGINYIDNSAGLNGITNDWEWDGIVTTSQSADTKNNTVSNSCFVISGGSSLAKLIDNLVIGKTYTLTAKIKKTSELVNAFFKVVYNVDKEKYLVNSYEVYDWTEVSVVLDDITDGTVCIEMYSTGDNFYVSDIMLSEGRTVREWTPAPNEIYTEQVKIDRNGVEVSNDDSDTKTVINHTEFAVYHQDEKVITVNKDETHLKKSIVEEDLTIGKMKFLPLENPSEGGNLVILD